MDRHCARLNMGHHDFDVCLARPEMFDDVVNTDEPNVGRPGRRALLHPQHQRRGLVVEPNPVALRDRIQQQFLGNAALQRVAPEPAGQVFVLTRHRNGEAHGVSSAYLLMVEHILDDGYRSLDIAGTKSKSDHLKAVTAKLRLCRDQFSTGERLLHRA